MTHRAAPPAPGEVFEVVFPFVRTTYEAMDADSEGVTFTELPSWKPGTRHADRGEGDVETIADGFGRMILTVVSVHKPGRFPTRVFFTRQFVSPDGKVFGKTKCRIATVSVFRARAAGYGREFILAGCACKSCRWPTHDHRRSMEVA